MEIFLKKRAPMSLADATSIQLGGSSRRRSRRRRGPGRYRVESDEEDSSSEGEGTLPPDLDDVYDGEMTLGEEEEEGGSLEGFVVQDSPEPPPPRPPRTEPGPSTSHASSPPEPSKKVARVETSPGTANNSYSEGDDSASCVICFSRFMLSGPHKLFSLKCGHCFGHSCIQKYMQSHAGNKAPCPNCRAVSSVKDLRPVFPPNIKAWDNSEMERLRGQLEAKDLEVRKLFLRCDDLETRNKLMIQNGVGGGASSEARPSTSRAKAATSGPLRLESLRMAEPSSRRGGAQSLGRAFAVDAARSIVAASLKVDDNPVTSGFHYKVFSYDPAGSIHGSHQMKIHSSEIRSMAFHPSGNGILLSGSADGSAAFSSVHDAAAVARIAVGQGVWAVLFDPAEPMRVFLGTVKGQIFLYDRRRLGGEKTEPLGELTGETSPRPGVVSLSYLNKSHTGLPYNGVVGGHLNKVVFYEQTDAVAFSAHNIAANCRLRSLSGEPDGAHFLSTAADSQTGETLHQVWSVNPAVGGGVERRVVESWAAEESPLVRNAVAATKDGRLVTATLDEPKGRVIVQRVGETRSAVQTIAQSAGTKMISIDQAANADGQILSLMDSGKLRVFRVR